MGERFCFDFETDFFFKSIMKIIFHVEQHLQIIFYWLKILQSWSFKKCWNILLKLLKSVLSGVYVIQNV